MDVSTLQSPPPILSQSLPVGQEECKEAPKTPKANGSTELFSGRSGRYLLDLPDEILGHIIDFSINPLRDSQGLALRQVCKRFRDFPGFFLIIQQVELKARKIEWVHTNTLGKCFKQLRSLDLSNATLARGALSPLQELKQLSALNLNACRGVYEEALSIISKLTSLRVLNLGAYGKHYMEDVDLDLLGFSQDMLPCLRCERCDTPCQHLKSIKVCETTFILLQYKIMQTRMKKIDKDVELLSSLRHLRRLSLANSEISTEGAAHLIRLEQLESLNLTSCRNIQHESLLQLTKRAGLKTLILQ